MEIEKKNKIFKMFLIGLMVLFAIIPFSLKLKDINEVNAQAPSPSDFTPYALTYTNNWTSHNQTGISLTYSNRVWTDGTNIFYSNGDSQYVLDISTSTWSVKSWNGLNNFDGRYIWSDGTNIFYSQLGPQYVLDVSTSTWSVKSWNGLNNFDGRYIWTDGTNIFYSNDTSQYVLDISTSTWSVKSWNGLNNFDGRYIWSDGINIFYSQLEIQYVLDVSTSTWSVKSWTGLTTFDGRYIWSDGTNIFYSNDTSQYVLDISTSTWSVKSWTGLTNFSGLSVFSKFPGVIICYFYNASSSGLWYTLDINNSGGGTGGGEQTNTYYHYTGTNFNLLSYAYANSYRVGNVYFEIEDISSTNYTVSINYLMLNGYGDINNTITYNVSSALQSSSITGILGSVSVESGTDFNSQVYNNQYPYYVYIHTDGWTNSDVSGCSISTTLGTLSNGINVSPYLNGVNIITYVFRYFNSSNDSLFIELSGIYDSSLISSMPLQMINRTYYFDNGDTTSGNYQTGYDVGYSAGLSQGYNNGYNAGSNASYSTGYDAGLSQGYTNGYNAGDSAGYNRGVLAASDYSFLSLIGAVVDAPVTAFSSLLNFNVLGVNILDFLTGLLTLALCLLVVKFIMGGWK